MHLTGAVPFLEMLKLLTLWFGISVPLVFMGAYAGYRQEPLAFPVVTSNIPKQVSGGVGSAEGTRAWIALSNNKKLYNPSPSIPNSPPPSTNDPLQSPPTNNKQNRCRTSRGTSPRASSS